MKRVLAALSLLVTVGGAWFVLGDRSSEPIEHGTSEPPSVDRATLLGGIVVDAANRPIAGAMVVAMEESGSRRVWHGDVGRHETTDSMADGHNGGTRAPLRDVPPVTTDTTGRFRLVGEPPKKRLHVGVELDGHYLTAEPKFELGASDVRLVMSAAGGVAGSLLEAEGVGWHDLEVKIDGETALNGDAEHYFGMWGGRRLRLDDKGRFEIRTLRPGKAHVTVHRANWDVETPLLDVSDVEVVAGRMTRDPRLQDIDLVTKLRGPVVTVRDAAGNPVRDATVRFRQSAKDASWGGPSITAEDGTTRITVAPGDSGLDVVVTATGLRPAERSGVREDAEFVLEAAKSSTVHVRLPADTALAPAPFLLSAALRWFPDGSGDPADEYDRDPRDIDLREKFSATRVLKFPSVNAGRYRVGLTLVESGPRGGGASYPFRSLPPVIAFTVPGDGADVEVTVNIDAAALRDRTSK